MKAKVSFHGHSTYSDGISSIKKLVSEAVNIKLDYFGLSDHNTVKHITPFYQAVTEINQIQGHLIIPICACETTLTLSNGRADIIFAKPGKLDLDFVSWNQNCIDNSQSINSLDQLIKIAINEYNAIVVIPHPQMPFTPSANFNLIEELSQKLNSKEQKNVGVEIRNWNSNIFPRNSLREQKLTNLVKKLDLALFGLADYHCASDLGKMYTLAEVSEKTAEQLLIAVQNRLVSPGRIHPANPIEYMTIAYNLSRASVRSVSNKLLFKKTKNKLK